MTDTPFKVGETYRTRDGQKAVLLVCDFDLEHPLIFKIKANGDWYLAYRDANGMGNPDFDLPRDILPPRRGVWVPVDAATGIPVGAYHSLELKKPGAHVDGCEWRFFIEAEDQP